MMSTYVYVRIVCNSACYERQVRRLEVQAQVQQEGDDPNLPREEVRIRLRARLLGSSDRGSFVPGSNLRSG